MRFKQHREDVKVFREMNCSGIAGRYYRLILAAEEGMKGYNRLYGGLPPDLSKRLQAVLKDAKGE